MSKPGKLLTAFLVGGMASSCIMSFANAQSVNDLRGSIDQSSISDDDPLVFNRAQQDADDIIFGSENLSTIDEEPDQVSQNTPASARNSQPVVRPAAPASPVAGSSDPDGSPRANTATPAVQAGNIPVEDTEDPFAPVGIRFGTYDVNYALEQAIGYSDNVSEAVDGDGGGFSETSFELRIASDWSRHEWEKTNVNGSYQRPFDSDEIDEPRLDIDTSLRLDLIDGYTLTTRGFYNIQTQGFTSSTLVPGAIDTPNEQSWGGSTELERAEHKLQFRLRGEIEREEFEDADLAGGLVQSQGDRDNDEYRIVARVGYEVSPAYTPFIEGAYAIRDFKVNFDRNGNQRDSDIYELRGGFEIDLGEKLSGEIAVGYINESFDDPLLQDLDTVTINGQIDWSPERETIISLSFGTETDDSITLNENGSIIYNARLDYQRQISRRFSVNAFADTIIEDNEDNDRTIQIGFGTQYWVNRFTALTTRIEYLDFDSDEAGSSFNETSGQIGIRFQR